MPSGPSHFVDVKNVTYDGIAIYAVSNIRISQKNGFIFGEDNNSLRSVSSHKVRIEETVSFETEDGNAINELDSHTGAGNLEFDWVPAEETLTEDALGEQHVIIANVVITDADTNFVTKGMSKGVVQGRVMGVADNADPVTFTAASSMSSESSSS